MLRSVCCRVAVPACCRARLLRARTVLAASARTSKLRLDDGGSVEALASSVSAMESLNNARAVLCMPACRSCARVRQAIGAGEGGHAGTPSGRARWRVAPSPADVLCPGWPDSRSLRIGKCPWARHGASALRGW